MNARRRMHGFSLIEVVLTLALLGLLASMAAPLTETVVRRGKEQELRTALYQIRDAIDAYKRAFDAGYIEKSLNSSGYPPNLKVLVEGVRDVRSAKGAKFYFLRRIPRDPLVPAKRDDEGGWGVRAYDSSAQNPRDGEDVFFRHLLDGSRAANRIGWQWTVGALTGKPYGFSRWQVEKRAPGLCDTCSFARAFRGRFGEFLRRRFGIGGDHGDGLSVADDRRRSGHGRGAVGVVVGVIPRIISETT